MAAGPYDLYRVDPFVPEVEWLSNVQNANLSGGMLDIDTDTEGQLVIVKKDGLYALPVVVTWWRRKVLKILMGKQ